MPTTKTAGKVECLNPNTGGRMNIDADTYELFSKAIYHTLMGGKSLTFTQMVQGVQDCFHRQKTRFSGSVSWYTVTVKNDMEAKGITQSFMERGKKLHRLVVKKQHDTTDAV